MKKSHSASLGREGGMRGLACTGNRKAEYYGHGEGKKIQKCEVL